jgi:hypothetical protein
MDEGSMSALGSIPCVSRMLAVEEASPAGRNRFAGSMIGEIPLPLPRNYIQGIDVQKRDFEDGRWSFFCGEWRHGGWWYYYLYAIAVKVPLGTLLLNSTTLESERGRNLVWKDKKAWS